jgi:hypothetical protein
MWMLVPFPHRPDAAVWRGRRALAVMDGLLWPGLLAWLVVEFARGEGVVSAVTLAGCGLGAVSRVRRALSRNERYRFTTWRWLKLVCVLGWIALCIRMTTNGVL